MTDETRKFLLDLLYGTIELHFDDPSGLIGDTDEDPSDNFKDNISELISVCNDMGFDLWEYATNECSAREVERMRELVINHRVYP